MPGGSVSVGQDANSSISLLGSFTWKPVSTEPCRSLGRGERES